MLLLRHRAHARAGLMGNPSDGYHGKTISFAIREFFAEVVLYEWEDVEIVWSDEERSRFGSIDELVRDVALHGYYGGVRLVKATLRTFAEHCRNQRIDLHKRNFSVRYQSTIPRQVGLAGSSAIIVATLRCLMEFYGVSIPKPVQASLARSVETHELGIPAGLQDRVIQVYEGLVYMDFTPERTTEQQGFECGEYEAMDPALLPPLYLAFSRHESEPTERVHNDLRGRFDRGEPEVVDAMRQFAQFADDARDALRRGDHDLLGRLIDRNFDLRASICRIAAGQRRMIELARQCGACAKFAGSGGAIIGICETSSKFDRLRTAMETIGCRVLRPTIQRSADPSTSG